MNNAFKTLLLTALLALFCASFAQTGGAPASESTLSGSFVGADAQHEGEGSVQLVEENGERAFEFSEDFRSTRGPDLFVWLVNGDDVENRVNLGRLQSASGAQRYVIPEEVNLDEYDRVIIWCRAFRVLFSTAVLE